MKRDFNAWLATLGASAPVKTLAELRAWNTAHASRGAIKYGQGNLDISDDVDLERDQARWEADRKKDIALGATRGIDEVMKAHKLDAIVFPGASGAGIAAKPGYPTVIVPFGLVANAPTPAFPAGFEAKPIPYGVSFSGLACSEPRLIELAYAFEQATKKRVPPAGVSLACGARRRGASSVGALSDIPGGHHERAVCCWVGIAVVAAAVGSERARTADGRARGAAARDSVDIVEASICELQNGLADGRFNSRDLVQAYLDRIDQYEGRVNATAAISASAMDEATSLDRERAAGHVRGPLHGIPIGIKDIINTTSMPTTGGGLAFAGFAPPYDAPLVKNLRDAGAIIFTKTVLTEFANWVTAGMPANYSGLFGYGYNPYDPRPGSARHLQRRPSGDGHRRVQLRHRHRAQLLGGQRRHRDLGLDPQPVEPEHARRHQADGRPDQPLRDRADHRRSGHRRADGPHGGRRGHPARRAWSASIRTTRPPTPACRRRARTTPASCGWPACAARASASRGPASTAATTRPDTGAAVGGLNAAAARGDGGGHRHPEARRRRRSSIRPRSRATSTARPTATSTPSRSAPARPTARATTRRARRCSSTA